MIYWCSKIFIFHFHPYWTEAIQTFTLEEVLAAKARTFFLLEEAKVASGSYVSTLATFIIFSGTTVASKMNASFAPDFLKL